jgi:DNA replication protein DnaC
MLAHPTQERLLALGLTGMATALEDQRRQPDIAALAFEERLALLLDRETMERENKRLVARLRFATLRQEAVVEDVDLRARLDRALFQKLAAGDWIDRKQNLLVIGPTGVGKSWIACALGHKACRDNRSVTYHRVPRLLEGSRRWPLWTAAEGTRTGAAADPGRLGSGTAHQRAAARPAGDHGRPA